MRIVWTVRLFLYPTRLHGRLSLMIFRFYTRVCSYEKRIPLVVPSANSFVYYPFKRFVLKGCQASWSLWLCEPVVLLSLSPSFTSANLHIGYAGPEEFLDPREQYILRSCCSIAGIIPSGPTALWVWNSLIVHFTDSAGTTLSAIVPIPKRFVRTLTF